MTETSFSRRMSRVRPSAIRELMAHAADPDLISFGGGYHDERLFPITSLRRAFDDVLRAGGGAALQYSPSDGLVALRTIIADRMSAHGDRTSADEVVVLHGAQQGLDLVAKLFLDPDDVVMVEDPTFLGALIAFNPFEPRYVTVRTDDAGLDTDHLETLLESGVRPRFVYTVPDFQNPTGATLTIDRRRHLLRLAVEHDFIVVEDSPYRELRFEGTALPTLHQLDSAGRVVHIGSFSKVLAPGLRLGWAAAPPRILERLLLLKLAADTQSSTVNMAATATLLQTFDVDAHIDTVRAAYRSRRDLMLDSIEAAFPPGIAATRASGGLFTWLTFPEHVDTADFQRRVALPSAKVAYVPGESFFAGEPRRNHARLNFSSVSDEQIVEGIQRLGAALWQDRQGRDERS